MAPIDGSGDVSDDLADHVIPERQAIHDNPVANVAPPT
jgi:hypothetical protein